MGAILILFGNKITQQCRKITFSVGQPNAKRFFWLPYVIIIFWFDTGGNNRRHLFFLQYYVVRAIWNDHLFIKLMMRCLTCRLLTIYFLFTDWCWMKIFTVASGSKKMFLKLKKNVLQFIILSPFADFARKLCLQFGTKLG